MKLLLQSVCPARLRCFPDAVARTTNQYAPIGKDRQPFIAERERLTAEARKRGPRKPSDASTAYAATVKKPAVRRPRDLDRNRDVKRTGLPGVVAHTR